MQKMPLKALDNFEPFVAVVEGYFDEIVEQGSDQELFISSYLQGHFAVAVGQCQVEGLCELNRLITLMAKSLDNASADKELEDDDQEQVRELWVHFLEKHTS